MHDSSYGRKTTTLKHGSQHSAQLSSATISIEFLISSSRTASGVISWHLPGTSIPLKVTMRSARCYRHV